MEFFHKEFNTKDGVKEWFREQYIDNGLSSNEIGVICGVNGRTIRYWLKKFGIPRRTASEWTKGKGNYFYGKHFWGKTNAMYGLRLENHPAWVGGNRKTYHNTARKALEEWWNQPMPSGYLAHHLDKNRKNNNITNLAWLTNRGHALIHQCYKNLGGYCGILS